jgi:hypothetical protein
MRAWRRLIRRRTSYQLTQAVNDVIGRTDTDNERTLEGTRAYGLELPPMRACVERVLRHCLDTNWRRRR